MWELALSIFGPMWTGLGKGGAENRRPLLPRASPPMFHLQAIAGGRMSHCLGMKRRKIGAHHTFPSFHCQEPIHLPVSVETPGLDPLRQTMHIEACADEHGIAMETRMESRCPLSPNRLLFVSIFRSGTRWPVVARDDATHVSAWDKYIDRIAAAESGPWLRPPSYGRL